MKKHNIYKNVYVTIMFSTHFEEQLETLSNKDYLYSYTSTIHGNNNGINDNFHLCVLYTLKPITPLDMIFQKKLDVLYVINNVLFFYFNKNEMDIYTNFIASAEGDLYYDTHSLVTVNTTDEYVKLVKLKMLL